jgi:hypothetical protein
LDFPVKTNRDSRAKVYSKRAKRHYTRSNGYDLNTATIGVGQNIGLLCVAIAEPNRKEGLACNQYRTCGCQWGLAQEIQNGFHAVKKEPQAYPACGS